MTGFAGGRFNLKPAASLDIAIPFLAAGTGNGMPALTG